MRIHNPILRFLLALLALTAVPGLADARGEPPRETARPAPPPKGGNDDNPYVQRFKALDANRDGYVTLDEWPLEEAKFHVVDRDKDGRLSQHELLTPNVPRRDPFEDRFRELDTNRDGVLSQGELERGGEGFTGRDRDGDGTVSPHEFRSGFQDVWNPRADSRDQRRFDRLDRNRDRRLNRRELGGSRTTFDRLDRNRDGVLSPSEWQ